MTRALPLAVVLFASALGFSFLMGRAWPVAFPPFSAIPAGPFALQDASLASTGFRAAAADLAWIQLLQYAAGEAPPELMDRPGHGYEHIKSLSLRVVGLDPSFHRAILYGAGILGWFKGVERIDEAVELLETGMRTDPSQPLYRLYLAALAYKKAGDADKMIALLEASFEDPGTPSQMRAILANTRKARGEYRQALDLWRRILEADRDASEHTRARLQIDELKLLLANKRD